MCQQPYARCRNLKCDGFSVLLPIIPCANRPNCEVIETIIPMKDRPNVYCPNCRNYTKAQRKNQSTKAWRQRAKAKKALAQGGGTNVTESHTHAEVEQQAESSTIGETSGHFGGGIRSDSNDPFPGTEEFEEYEEYDPAVTPVSNRANPPSSPQIPIDPVLLELDAMYPNGISTVRSAREAEKLFENKESRHEPSDSNKSNQ